jgi:hypothetical protein
MAIVGIIDLGLCWHLNKLDEKEFKGALNLKVSLFDEGN